MRMFHTQQCKVAYSWYCLLREGAPKSYVTLRFPDTTRRVMCVRSGLRRLQRRDDVATSVGCDNRELRHNHRVELSVPLPSVVVLSLSKVLNV